MNELNTLTEAVANMIKTIPADNNEQIETHYVLLSYAQRIRRLKEFREMISRKHIRFA